MPTDLISLAARRLGVEPAQIVGLRRDEDGEHYSILVDFGIAGTKKYRLSAADLVPAPSVPQAELTAPEPPVLPIPAAKTKRKSPKGG